MDCSICTVFTDAPRTLPCGHLFCLNCLQHIYSRNVIKCPDCRAVHTLRPTECTRVYLPAPASTGMSESPPPATPARSVGEFPPPPTLPSLEDEEAAMLREQQQIIDESHRLAEEQQLAAALAASQSSAAAAVRPVPVGPVAVRSAPPRVRTAPTDPIPGRQDWSFISTAPTEYYVPKPTFKSWFLYIIGIGKLEEPVPVPPRSAFTTASLLRR